MGPQHFHCKLTDCFAFKCFQIRLEKISRLSFFLVHWAWICPEWGFWDRIWGRAGVIVYIHCISWHVVFFFLNREMPLHKICARIAAAHLPLNAFWSVNEKFEGENIEKKKKSRSLETLLVHSYSWHVIEAVLSADDGTRLASQAGRRHHRQQIWILGTGPLPYYFASNNTWIVTINHQK